MSLTTAFNIAQNSLLNTSRQTSVVSRNVQESNNPDYSRRSAVVVSTAPGARVVQIQRATDDQLFRANLSALSQWSGQSVMSEGLERLELFVNGVDNDASVATAVSKLQQAMQLYSATPSNRSLAESALEAARQVASTLNSATNAIQSVRADTDARIGEAVTELNNLLQEFKKVNDTVVGGTAAGKDVSDSLDQRDALLKKIAAYVPINTQVRTNNDMMLTTQDGATLFEKVPRNVSFTPTSVYGAVTTGNQVYIDGMSVSLGAGSTSEAPGSIAGLLKLRDNVAVTLQNQLDEVARGLITAFRETDQPGGAVVPDAPGLFTWPGAPGMPAAATLVKGMAGSITINAAFDSSVGGNPELLRDGGANGAGYVANTGGNASFTDLLLVYADRMDTDMAFDTAAGAGTDLTLARYASASVGWFAGVRKESAAIAESKQALAARTEEALSNATGVNVDTEMSLLLELENSYQASARLLRAVDEMMQQLFAAVG